MVGIGGDGMPLYRWSLGCTSLESEVLYIKQILEMTLDCVINGFLLLHGLKMSVENHVPFL